MQFLQESLIELITQTSTNLPPDVRQAMGIAMAAETPGTQASQALNIIASNIDMAESDEGPICQDTGMPTFDVHTPIGVSQIEIKKAIRAAVAEATKRGKLRPNSVDSLTGKNSGDNLGIETPVIHFEQWEHDEIEVKLVLKGGGCENKNIQYSLPCELEHLGKAGRDIEGVRKCILHSVWQAQGQGCAPGAIGVCIGSDRAHGYVLAKNQLFRTLDDVNTDPRLAELEAGRSGVRRYGPEGQTTPEDLADMRRQQRRPFQCRRQRRRIQRDADGIDAAHGVGALCSKFCARESNNRRKIICVDLGRTAVELFAQLFARAEKRYAFLVDRYRFASARVPALARRPHLY